MSLQPLEVTATRDDEANVWVAECPRISGIITEAATKEEMLRKLSEIIPILLEENDEGGAHPDLPYHMMWQQVELAHLNRA